MRLFLNEKVVGGGVFLVEVFERFFDDQCPQMAAALAYYAIFSIPPLFIIVMMTTGSLLDPATVQQLLAGSASPFISPQAGNQLMAFAQTASGWAQEGPWWSVALSAVGLFFGATRAFAQLQTALNRAWAIPEKHPQNPVRSFVSKRLVSFAAITVMIVMVLALLIVRAVLERFGTAFDRVLPSTLISLLHWGSGTTLSLATGFVVLTLVYRFLPDAKITWKHVIPGAAATAVIFEGTKSLMTLYLTHVRADFFGQAASFAVLMLWLYVSAILLFFGAEFTEVWARHHGRKLGPGETKLAIPTFTLMLKEKFESQLCRRRAEASQNERTHPSS